MLVLQGSRPAITRLTAALSTACRQLPSAESAWARNIHSVSVGGNTRWRCSGTSASTRSSSWAGQEVEEGAGIGVVGMIEDTLLLPHRGALVRMHGGWLPGWSVGFVAYNLPPLPAFPKLFSRLGLS